MRGIGDPLIHAEGFHIINLFFIWKSNVPLNCLLSLKWWHTGGESVEMVFCEVSSSPIKLFRYFGFQNDMYCYLTALVERIVDRHVTYCSTNDKHTLLKTPSLAVISRFMNVVSLWKWSHLCMGRLKYLKKCVGVKSSALTSDWTLWSVVVWANCNRLDGQERREKPSKQSSDAYWGNTHKQMKRSWDFGFISAFVPAIVHYQAVN